MEASCAIVIIGNEILSGKVSDANGPFLIQQLRELGVTVSRLIVVPDEVASIEAEIRHASRENQWVFTSGGVGPTLDDVTFAGLARAFGDSLHAHPDLEKIIRGHFGKALNETHLRMAKIPRRSELLWTEGLPWPVVKIDNVWVFPGEPALLRKKFLGIRERFRHAPFHSRRVYTKAEESDLAPILDAVFADNPDVVLGSYPVQDHPEHTTWLTLEGKEVTRVDEALKDLLRRVDARWIVRVE